ncbi:hypothetical protein ABZY16_25100 [Streptomyces sp. NPDC006553]|uniref:hypothetical protein n=1 Tax=Streptomyces sp. NPDC006553 TaxID=3157180 RepID=UPI00339F850F
MTDQPARSGLGSTLTDHHTEASIEVINAKAEPSAPAFVGGEEAQEATVADLMASLEAPVAKESRSETGGPATVHEMPEPKNRAAAKKTAAKRAPSKKRPGRVARRRGTGSRLN